MDKTNKRSATFLITVIAFLVLLMLFILLYLPSNKELSSVKAKKDELNNKVQTLQNVLDKKITKKGKLDEEAVQAALPLWDNTEELILQLNEIGKESKAEIKDGRVNFVEKSAIEPRNEASEVLFQDVRQLVVSLTINGTASEVMYWVELLENLPRLIIVTSFDLRKGDTDGTAVVDISFVALFDPNYESMLKNPILPETSD